PGLEIGRRAAGPAIHRPSEHGSGDQERARAPASIRVDVLIDERKAGAPGGTRTHNPQLRRLVLYPVELRAPVVGVERFELPTSCSQSRRATRLRYTPTGQHTTPVRAVWSTLGFQTDSGLPPL